MLTRPHEPPSCALKVNTPEQSMHVNPCPSGRPSSRPPERKVRLYPSVQSPSSRVDYMWKRNNAQMELAGLPGGPARPIAGRPGSDSKMQYV